MENELKTLLNKLKSGSNAATVLYGNNMDNSHHYIDALQRFQKDFAVCDKKRRQQQKYKKQNDIEKKRIQYFERESKRWENVQNKIEKQKQSRQIALKLQAQRKKRTANLPSLAFNPINLQYQKSNQGQKLKVRDEDNLIRGYVRAHNMDNKGNSRYNVLTGQQRRSIQRIVPEKLYGRFGEKLNEHYDSYSIKLQTNQNHQISNKQRY